MNKINAKLNTVIKNVHGKCSPESDEKDLSMSSLASGIKCSTPTARNSPPENAEDKDSTSGFDLKLLERKGTLPVIMIIENMMTMAETLMIVVSIIE